MKITLSIHGCGAADPALRESGAVGEAAREGGGGVPAGGAEGRRKRLRRGGEEEGGGGAERKNRGGSICGREPTVSEAVLILLVFRLRPVSALARFLSPCVMGFNIRPFCLDGSINKLLI
jgi:hypothetical protein